jgi:NAD+ diphosphatase
MTRIVFVGSRPVLEAGNSSLQLPSAGRLEEALGPVRLAASRMNVEVRGADGSLVDVHVLGDDDIDVVESSGLKALPLRAAWRDLGAVDFRMVGTARQKADWILTHRFCSRCAAPTALDPETEGLRCSACSQVHYPRVAPAVIVLVQRGREALLGRSPRFPEGVYSTLAGFVEPGETLEECVHREIEEEAGVRVHNLRYFGSQPHPFPHSLMVGFIADWLQGDLCIDPTELTDAQWFDVDDLPLRPHPRSIAFRLIADFEQRVRG